MGKNGKYQSIRQLWNIKTLPGRNRFRKWLTTIDSGKQWCNEKSLVFLTSLGFTYRKWLMARIKLVDPESFDTIRKMQQRVRGRRLRQREAKVEALAKVQLHDDKLAIAERVWESTGVTKFRFVQASGVLNIIASMLASGYSKQEVVDSLQVELEIVNRVTPEMVSEMKKRIPAAIIQAANQIVHKDLLSGEITKNTMAAHKIAADRMKLVVSAEGSRRRGLSPAEIERKTIDIEEKFGVKVEDVKGEEA